MSNAGIKQKNTLSSEKASCMQYCYSVDKGTQSNYFPSFHHCYFYFSSKRKTTFLVENNLLIKNIFKHE